jgi:uncharacterized Tic20 family protein
MSEDPGSTQPRTPEPVPYQSPGATGSAGLPPPPAGYVVTDDDRTMAMLIHLGLILAAVLSLIIWLIKRENSPFVEHHGKQALAFFIAFLVATAIVIPLCFVCVGFFLLPVLIALHLAFPIVAALAANRGEWYRYPLVGGMIK